MSEDIYTDHAIRQADLTRIARERFGDDPRDWAFVCPNCGDVATGRDFQAALAERPATRRDGSPVMASDRLGQECLGRSLGALTMSAQEWQQQVRSGAGRGCDWVAYGLFSGPVFVIVERDGETRKIPSFRLAAA